MSTLAQMEVILARDEQDHKVIDLEEQIAAPGFETSASRDDIKRQHAEATEVHRTLVAKIAAFSQDYD